MRFPIVATPPGAISEIDVIWLKDWSAQLAVLFIFLGIHACLYLLSAYLLIKEGLRNSRSRLFLFLCTSAMVLVSLLHATLTTEIPALAIPLLSREATLEDAEKLSRAARPLKIAVNVLLRVNFAISDTVVVWRAYVLFQESRRARLCLAACLCGTYAAITLNTALIVLEITGHIARSTPRSLLLTIPLLTTNGTATGMMAWKAWIHREYVRDSFLRRKHKSRAELALLLLVESGLVYCGVWVLAMAASLGAVPGTASSTILGSLCSICGAYPTLIVIMIGLQRSSVDSLLGESALIPLSPARWSGMSQASKKPLVEKRRSGMEGAEALMEPTAPISPPSGRRESWPAMGLLSMQDGRFLDKTSRSARAELSRRGAQRASSRTVKRASSPPNLGRPFQGHASRSLRPASQELPSPTSHSFEPLLGDALLGQDLPPRKPSVAQVEAPPPIFLNAPTASFETPPAFLDAPPAFLNAPFEGVSRPRKGNRLSYPTMAWESSSRTSWEGGRDQRNSQMNSRRDSFKGDRKGFVRLSTVEEA
ncbi:hypothetical protein BD626DRAFT_273940 [Schizophyllum amplum]|uniref:Uncharacterized protein n=1 Tax=Schizophyllum amplum TaxID=97359 RepID=A0A550CFM4_9AGAR|nr:hypothetical protein BD626DRAFT_273940 [Auriculariopsis ampla]